MIWEITTMLCNHACIICMLILVHLPSILLLSYMMIILSMRDIGGVVPDWTVLNLMIDLCQVSYWPHWLLSMAALLFRGELLVHISLWANIILFFMNIMCMCVCMLLPIATKVFDGKIIGYRISMEGSAWWSEGVMDKQISYTWH